MKFILGKKLGMTQKFSPDGRVWPCTIVEAGPCVVTAVRTKDKDHYQAVQIGFGSKKRVNKPLFGQWRNLKSPQGQEPKFKWLKEFQVTEDINLQPGVIITVDNFKKDDKVDVIGVTKGRGFQGVVKRHGFSGSPKTHGHKDQLRMPGSIGSTGPQRVFKGVRMGGHMGQDQVTVKNLTVIEVEPNNNKLYLYGAVPGAVGGLLLISGNGDLVVKSTDQVLTDKQLEPTAVESSVEPVQQSNDQPAEPTDVAQESNN